MAVDQRLQLTQPSEPGADESTGDLIDRLTRFDGPPELFLCSLLAVQCRIGSADGGAILRLSGGDAEVLALFPPPPSKDSPAPDWLVRAIETAGSAPADGRVRVREVGSGQDLYGQPSGRHAVLVPLGGARPSGQALAQRPAGIAGPTTGGLAAFCIRTFEPAVLNAARERLELTVPLLNLYEMRLTLGRRQSDLHRLRVAMETLAAVEEQDRLAATAMALCNETAARWQADRVSLGLLKGRYVKLRALSHTEKFSRKQKLVGDLESAMEECLDQDVEVIHPPPGEATFVCRSAAELSRRHGPLAIASLPLRRAGRPIGVLTVERPLDQPFTAEEVEALRLTCDLVAPRVATLAEHDRWIGAKAAGGLRRGLAWLVGPKHTWAKVAAILVLGAILFVSLVKGDHQAEAPFVLELADRQVVSAPFDGTLKAVNKVPGDQVRAGETLAELHTWKLDLQLASAQADLVKFQGEADLARRDGQTARQQIAQADADRVAAQIELLRRHIEQARIAAPIDGLVLAGEWRQAWNKELKTGEPLFELAPDRRFHAELAVPEDQIGEVRVGQRGQLAANAYPGRRIEFVVERISPVAEVVDQRNVFKVRVRLVETEDWMRAGMEGVGKIHLGRQVYAQLWTRRLVNWLRMTLWLDV